MFLSTTPKTRKKDLPNYDNMIKKEAHKRRGSTISTKFESIIQQKEKKNTILPQSTFNLAPAMRIVVSINILEIQLPARSTFSEHVLYL